MLYLIFIPIVVIGVPVMMFCGIMLHIITSKSISISLPLNVEEEESSEVTPN